MLREIVVFISFLFCFVGSCMLKANEHILEMKDETLKIVSSTLPQPQEKIKAIFSVCDKDERIYIMWKVLSNIESIVAKQSLSSLLITEADRDYKIAEALLFSQTENFKGKR